MKEQPNYFAIIPANVRYDKELRANEKLMYGEITALSNSNGFCWASNNYFAELYKVTPQAISKWIKDLKNKGYIQVDFEYKNGTKEIDKRIIKIVSTNDLEVSTNDLGGINKCLTPCKQKFKDNNINNNNTRIIKHIYGKYKNVKLTDEEYQKLVADNLEYMIDILSEGKEMKGYTYKSDYLAVRKWAKSEKPKEQIKATYDLDKITRETMYNDDFDI